MLLWATFVYSWLLFAHFCLLLATFWLFFLSVLNLFWLFLIVFDCFSSLFLIFFNDSFRLSVSYLCIFNLVWLVWICLNLTFHYFCLFFDHFRYVLNLSSDCFWSASSSSFNVTKLYTTNLFWLNLTTLPCRFASPYCCSGRCPKVVGYF